MYVFIDMDGACCGVVVPLIVQSSTRRLHPDTKSFCAVFLNWVVMWDKMMMMMQLIRDCHVLYAMEGLILLQMIKWNRCSLDEEEKEVTSIIWRRLLGELELLSLLVNHWVWGSVVFISNPTTATWWDRRTAFWIGFLVLPWAFCVNIFLWINFESLFSLISSYSLLVNVCPLSSDK